MITGTADLDRLADTAPTIAAWSDEDLVLGSVECFQMIAEMRSTAREAVLPAALHPTIPPALSIQAWNAGDSPWGPFSMVHTRAS
ncbi:MAG: hypothetical protein AAFO29_24865, partial [Actinomycetota bacterium]